MPYSPEHVNSLWYSGILSSTCQLVKSLYTDISLSLAILAVDSVAAHHNKSATQLLSLWAVAGITTGVAMRTAGLATSLSLTISTLLKISTLYDFQHVQTIFTLPGRINSLAPVVRQNWIELLTVEEGGLCLFLQAEWCFYVNQFYIVKNKIQQLQTDLQKHKEQFNASDPQAFIIPVWNHDSSSYYFIFLFLLFAPYFANFFSTYLQGQIQNISNQMVNQFLLQDYQLLANQYQMCPDSENQLHPKIDDGLGVQDAV